jgi:hypothetical protein
MDNRIIQPKGMAEAAGPFSRAVLIRDHLHIAGTTALSHVSGDYYDRNVPGTKRKTSRLQIIKFSLQRTAGPYKRARRRHRLDHDPSARVEGIVN